MTFPCHLDLIENLGEMTSDIESDMRRERSDCCNRNCLNQLLMYNALAGLTYCKVSTVVHFKCARAPPFSASRGRFDVATSKIFRDQEAKSKRSNDDDHLHLMTLEKRQSPPFSKRTRLL